MTDTTLPVSITPPAQVVPIDCDDLFETLGIPSARNVLTEATTNPVTIDELVEMCEVSRTTVYRRVNDLLDLGILEKSIRLTGGGQQCREFQTTEKLIRLKISAAGLQARLEPISDENRSTGELAMDNSSVTQLQFVLSGEDVRCQIERNNHRESDTGDCALRIANLE